MQRDWNLLATSSHYNTAVAVHEELRVGKIDNAIAGLEDNALGLIGPQGLQQGVEGLFHEEYFLCRSTGGWRRGVKSSRHPLPASL